MEMQAPKGTKDMLPQDAYKWHYVENVFKRAVEEFGMGYPSKSQIIYYQKSDEGFVYQMEDIPRE